MRPGFNKSIEKVIKKSFKKRNPKQWILGIVALAAIGLFQYFYGDGLITDKSSNITSFEQAKRELVKIYKAYPDQEEFYCGCDFTFNNQSGVVDLASCGYVIRNNPERANRIEWEHVVPAHAFGKNMQCWKDGGRSGCKVGDVDENTLFKMMEGDMHNLQPAVGEINADRSNFSFAELTPQFNQYGACQFRTDFKKRQVLPRDEVKGMIARTYLYMNDRYNVPFTSREMNLMQKWHLTFPPTSWECERNEIILDIQGNDNPFITESCNANGIQWSSHQSRSFFQTLLQNFLKIFE